MRTFIFLFLLTPALYARTVCRGYGNLNLSLNDKEKTFDFNQFCWNPCNMGDGVITAGPTLGWAGLRYKLELTRSTEMISPLESRTMHLLLDHGRQFATLSAGSQAIDLECEEVEDL